MRIVELLPLKVIHHKELMVGWQKVLTANSADPNQTAPLGAV